MNNKFKLELVFVKKSDDPAGYTVLGHFTLDGTVPAVANIPIPSIGERILVDLPQTVTGTGGCFAGQVTGKAVIYTQKDMEGKPWDLVMRIVLALELDSAGAESIYSVRPIRPN